MQLTDQVALSLAPGSRRRIADAFVSAEQLDGRLHTALDLLGGVEGPVDAAGLRDSACAALELARAAGLQALPLGDPSYPALLAEIRDPPVILWVSGSIDALCRPAIAIVGSRAASPAGLEVAVSVSRGLAQHGVTIVSGLARGCDGAAHRGALSADGSTIGVLGSGPDVIYPAEHAGLASELRRRGALLSELPPGTPPLSHHFPLRNRIISGLSLGIVVVQADERSGSLITAACGLDQGREVMAVPGGVPGGRNKGSHALLKDGATLIETAEDVFTAVPLLKRLLADGGDGRPHPHAARDDERDEPVLAAMRPGEDLDVDELAERCDLPLPEILARLGHLELGGRVVRLPGGRFVRAQGK